MSVCNSSFSTHTANVPYQPCSYVLCPFTQMPVCSYGEKEQLLDSVSLSPQSTLSNISISVCDYQETVQVLPRVATFELQQ